MQCMCNISIYLPKKSLLKLRCTHGLSETFKLLRIFLNGLKFFVKACNYNRTSIGLTMLKL